MQTSTSHIFSPTTPTFSSSSPLPLPALRLSSVLHSRTSSSFTDPLFTSQAINLLSLLSFSSNHYPSTTLLDYRHSPPFIFLTTLHNYPPLLVILFSTTSHFSYFRFLSSHHFLYLLLPHCPSIPIFPPFRNFFLLYFYFFYSARYQSPSTTSFPQSSLFLS